MPRLSPVQHPRNKPPIMSRIFITGSSDGLGLLTATSLVAAGHHVVLHARNSTRASSALAACPGAAGILVGDLSSIAQTKTLAHEANNLGTFDTVLHNAGVGFTERRQLTEDGVEHVFAINTLAPYILTCLMHRPKKLLYMSSGMHGGGGLEGLEKVTGPKGGRGWNGAKAYSDSKLFDVLLCFAVARHWPDVSSNAISPGWVKTKMGGAFAPGPAKKGAEIMTRLASRDPKDLGTGKYYASSLGSGSVNPAANDEDAQERLLGICEKLSGISLPRS